jgi:hypothetical protein
MKTLTIEVTNPEAYRHLKELEEMHLIHVMDSAVKPSPSLSQKFAGKLPAAVADELQQHIKRSRDEWNTPI